MESACSQLRQVQLGRVVLQHVIAALLGVNPQASGSSHGSMTRRRPLYRWASRQRRCSATRHRSPGQTITAAIGSIRVTTSAWFPASRLGASGGCRAARWRASFRWQRMVWALGAAVAQWVRRRTAPGSPDLISSRSGGLRQRDGRPCSGPSGRRPAGLADAPGQGHGSEHFAAAAQWSVAQTTQVRAEAVTTSTLSQRRQRTSPHDTGR